MLSTAGEPSADSITKTIFIFQIILHIIYVRLREKKKQARAWSIPGLVSDNQDYQIPVHESDFYFFNYLAY